MSEAGKQSHARVNSKSVHGAPVSRAGADAGVDGGRWGVSDAGRAGTSRVLITVSLPDTRNMPPPTRPTDFASRACFASLNDVGVGFCVAVGRAVDVGVGSSLVGADVGGDSTRELMGFRRSLVGWEGLADVEGGPGGCGVSPSTIVIGMRRRFGGAVAVEVEGEDVGVGRRGGAGTSTGADRCVT